MTEVCSKTVVNNDPNNPFNFQKDCKKSLLYALQMDVFIRQYFMTALAGLFGHLVCLNERKNRFDDFLPRRIHTHSTQVNKTLAVKITAQRKYRRLIAVNHEVTEVAKCKSLNYNLFCK
ncbi:unnamed protein product [Heterobilharzia americana]|nr:unnamed protein product [Heterobilharzia americana]